MAGRWVSIGLQLNIEDYTLHAITTPNGSNNEHCREMFRCWLAGEQGYGALPRTWFTVLQSVEKGYGSEVSHNIAELLHQKA